MEKTNPDLPDSKTQVQNYYMVVSLHNTSYLLNTNIGDRTHQSIKLVFRYVHFHVILDMS